MFHCCQTLNGRVNTGGFLPPPSNIGCARTPSKIGLTASPSCLVGVFFCGVRLYMAGLRHFYFSQQGVAQTCFLGKPREANKIQHLSYEGRRHSLSYYILPVFRTSAPFIPISTELLCHCSTGGGGGCFPFPFL